MGSVVTLLSQLAGVAALITAVATAVVTFSKKGPENRRTTAEAGKASAEAGKAAAESEVTVGGLSLQLSSSAVERMNRAESRADSAEKEARECRAEADQIRRERDDDHELIQDLQRSIDRVYELVAACPAGGVCPVADQLTRKTAGG